MRGEGVTKNKPLGFFLDGGCGMLSLVEQVRFVWRAQPLLAGFVRGFQDSKKLQALRCLLWCET